MMFCRHKLPAARRLLVGIGASGWLMVSVFFAACEHRSDVTSRGPVTLRVGVGGLPQQSPEGGLRQLVSNLSSEGLVNFNNDGRPRPWLVESWSTSVDHLSLTLQLRPQARFHDGNSVTAAAVVESLQRTLPGFMGPAGDDIRQIVAAGNTVEIKLRRPSNFVLEALDINLQKPAGPFIQDKGTTSSLRANPDYYLGPPSIGQVTVTPYPSVRTAWAELLRGKIDMLYEVNVDALDSLEGSSDVSVFSFVRHYQYMIVFSPKARVLQQPDVRRELNAAIDRERIVREAINGHGIPSTGPVPPQHWALEPHAPRIAFDGPLAARLAKRHLSFTCLVPADSVYERVALAVKQQLAAASVDMRVEEATQEQVVEAARNDKYEALLGDIISGPSLFRSYRHWYSKMPFNPKPIASPETDAALDSIGHAASDDEYRAGVTALQRAMTDNPPALFLVWGERARAVSRRFDVPMPENGRDVLATLRLWRPATVQQPASRN